MKNSPLISVVTVSYNAISTIEATLLSVIGQSFEDFEYLIIDGGSSDGTLDVIQKYSRHIDCLVSESDRGIYDGMNKAIRKAKGQWILFINCGDVFADSNVLQSLESSLRNPSVGVVYGDTIYQTTVGRYLLYPDSLSAMDFHLPFCHQSCLVRTELIRETPFDLSYRYVADYDLFYRLYQRGVSFHYEHLPIAVYDSTDGFTATNRTSCMLEHFKVNQRHPSLGFIVRLKLTNFLFKLLPVFFINAIRKRKYQCNPRFVALP